MLTQDNNLRLCFIFEISFEADVRSGVGQLDSFHVKTVPTARVLHSVLGGISYTYANAADLLSLRRVDAVISPDD